MTLKARIDPNILEKQNDWGDIYNSEVILRDSTLDIVDSSFNESIHQYNIKHFPMARKGALAFIWFHKAIEGSNIFYPSSELELTLYQLRSSSIYSTFNELCIFVIFLSPLIQNSECFATVEGGQESSNNEWGAFVLIATVVQFLDIYLYTRTTHWNGRYELMNIIKTDQIKTWHHMRIVVCIILILNSLVYLASNHNV